MAKKRNRKIVKYHKPLHINIGVLVFVLIFIYMMYFVVQYFTEKHISVYEVNRGSIAQNTVFQGLILRDETLYYASDSGYINYYYHDGSKANAGSCVYSIDETGQFYQDMTDSNNGMLQISEKEYQELEAVAEQFVMSYSDQMFSNVYQFKYDMEATLVSALSNSTRSQLDQAVASGQTNGLHVCNAPSAGVVVYNQDGLENVTIDSFSEEMFQKQNYQKENFLHRQKISSGEAVYKMINSEYWHIVIPVSEGIAQDLMEEENIKIRFLKDNTTAWGQSQIIQRQGNWFLVLELKNSMIRFATDRFVEVELLLTDTSGLKIPNTALINKDFITIPKEYLTKGGDSNNDGVFKEYASEDGKTVVEFVMVNVFYETEDCYYIDSEGVRLGDVLVYPNSNERYRLQDTAPLEGVYNVNKGYAVFRRVEKLFSNEEYTIIASGTSRGIAMYDHIALDSSAVSENEIIH